jgi:lipopolysaccharide transport system ATP-binding protein
LSTVIKVENLSKQYRLGTVGTGALAHDVNRWWHKVRGKEDPYLKIGEANDRTQKGESEYVWALKDINFEVKQGEVLGIIGRNGAGKSTLLKILSRTTAPTTGRIKIKGRVASLLEVGTGFHPELSGRENIYLNGAILGMTKSEIGKKFEEIVDFAGVERYIDTPVKRYSSGMYVRLAFGVAAHLEPEILIVDEVLAVGDTEFQKKALGKMKDASSKEGRTVLFVSHQMDAIKQLTNRTLLLKNGLIETDDDTDKVIGAYVNEIKLKVKRHHFKINELQPYFEDIKVFTSMGIGLHNFGDPLDIKIYINSSIDINSLETSFQIFNKTDESAVVYNWFSSSDSINEFKNKNGRFLVEINLPSLRLYKGEYYFKFHLSDPKGKVVFESIQFIEPFEIIMGNIYNEWGFRPGVGTYVENCNLEVTYLGT